MKTGAEGGDASYVRDGRLAAYVYKKTGDETYLQVAVDDLLRMARGERSRSLRHITGPESLNPIDEGLAGTNGASQNSLEVIAMLGLVGDDSPSNSHPENSNLDFDERPPTKKQLTHA